MCQKRLLMIIVVDLLIIPLLTKSSKFNESLLSLLQESLCKSCRFKSKCRIGSNNPDMSCETEQCETGQCEATVKEESKVVDQKQTSTNMKKKLLSPKISSFALFSFA
jgi:hypothetical protein